MTEGRNKQQENNKKTIEKTRPVAAVSTINSTCTGQVQNSVPIGGRLIILAITQTGWHAQP